eukprot:8416849-Karenia_brevis.AAC.1
MPLGSLADSNGRVGRGLLVGGVPVGDAVYVDAYLGMKAARAMSKTNKIVTQLRDVHLPFLWCCIYYALQPLFHDWLQHCYPTDSREHALVLDSDLFDAAA